MKNEYSDSYINAGSSLWKEYWQDEDKSLLYFNILKEQHNDASFIPFFNTGLRQLKSFREQIYHNFNGPCSSDEFAPYFFYSKDLPFFNSSSKAYITKDDTEFPLREQEENFLSLLENTEFEDGMDNRLTDYFQFLLDKYKESTLIWIQDFYLKHIAEENIVVKILTLFMDYSYDYLYPVSQMIALASKDHKSIAVKSAVFSLFGHWNNQAALDLLNAYDEPKEVWLKMKYNSLKQSIKKRCCM